MKIAIEKATGVALYKGDLRFETCLIGEDFMDARMTPDACDLIDMVPHPEQVVVDVESGETTTIPAYSPPNDPQPWCGGGWKYQNGEFVILDWWAKQYVEDKKYALVEQITESTQNRLDDFAKTRNYDGILSACTYATSSNPKFQAEGQYCVGARDETWAALYTIMAEVGAGTRPMPSGYADVEPDLPVLQWQTI